MKSILLIIMMFLMGCAATGESAVTTTLNKKAEDNVWRAINENPEFLAQNNTLADGSSINYDEDYYKQFREILKPVTTMKQYPFYGKDVLGNEPDARSSYSTLKLFGYGHILLSKEGKEIGEILTDVKGDVVGGFITARLEWAGTYESALKTYHQRVLPYLRNKNIQVDEVLYGYPVIYIRLKQPIPAQLQPCTDPNGWTILDYFGYDEVGDCGMPARQRPVEH